MLARRDSQSVPKLDIFFKTVFRLSKARIRDLRETVWTVENTGFLDFDREHGGVKLREGQQRPANKLAQAQIDIIERVVDLLTRSEPEATVGGAIYRICTS